MSTDTIKTELVVKHMAVGEQADVEKLKTAILDQEAVSRTARRRLAEGLAPAMPVERENANYIAAVTGARAQSRMRVTGTPLPTGRYRTNAAGQTLVDENGEPIPEMFTPVVGATVRSSPNAHRSDFEREIRRRRMRHKIIGTTDEQTTPSASQMAALIDRASAEDATEEDLLKAQYTAELFKQQQQAQKQAERFKGTRRRKELSLQTGLETYDPETGLRSFQRPLTPEQIAIHSKRLVDPLATEVTKAESEAVLRGELRTRRERARHTRETSKYDEKVLKDVEQIEKDAEATRKRLDVAKMRERLDVANAKLNQPPGMMTRTREQFLDFMARSPMMPFQGRTLAESEALRRKLSPLEEHQQRFVDRNKELDDKIARYRQLDREQRFAPEGREALKEIKDERRAIREDARDIDREQRAQEAEEKRAAQERGRRRQAIAEVFTTSGRELFNENKSIATTGLLGGLDKAAGGVMAAGLLTANPALFIAGTVAKTITQVLTGGLERGTELQQQAEKVYTAAEPMFAREEQQRAVRGLGNVRRYSNEAQRRAEAAARRLGGPDTATAASGTPEDIDIYSRDTTKRLRTIRQYLGSTMSLSDATQAYGQFRRQSGVVDMDTEQAVRAMQTGIYSGVPTELLARAATLGAIKGNQGGGVRTGLDQRLDIGTLRYQMETLGRAGLTGAPAEAILGQTLARQENFAALGLRTDFDRDAKFQRVLQESNIAPQQFGTITGTLDEMRGSLMQQLQQPGKEILSGLMMVNAFKQGKTYQGAMEYMAKTSSAQQLEQQLQTIGPGSGLLPLVAGALAPADMPAMMDSLRKVREGQTAGPAAATGEGTIDDAATERGRLENQASYSAIGAQRNMGAKAEIAQFQQTLDSAAKGIRAAADAMQSVAASAGNLLFN